jgi:replication-associated recombination protein RarA
MANPNPNHQALAERLRPKTLGEVIGQQHWDGDVMPVAINFICSTLMYKLIH